MFKPVIRQFFNFMSYLLVNVRDNAQQLYNKRRGAWNKESLEELRNRERSEPGMYNIRPTEAFNLAREVPNFV